jgi:hypothetical protein
MSDAPQSDSDFAVATEADDRVARSRVVRPVPDETLRDYATGKRVAEPCECGQRMIAECAALPGLRHCGAVNAREDAGVIAAAEWLMSDDGAYQGEPEMALRAARKMLSAADGARGGNPVDDLRWRIWHNGKPVPATEAQLREWMAPLRFDSGAHGSMMMIVDDAWEEINRLRAENEELRRSLREACALLREWSDSVIEADKDVL